MTGIENKPQGFGHYEPSKSLLGAYLALSEKQRNTLDGLVMQAVDSCPNQDPCTIIEEATGIGHIAVATALVANVRDGTLRPGKETLLEVNAG